jgi:hypothetical protein
VAGRIMHLRDGEFQQEEEVRLRVCWREIAVETKERFCRWIDLLPEHFAEAVLQI